MAVRSFCSTCGRTVYVDKGDKRICPVCSSPLLETVEEKPEETQALEGGA